MGEYKNGPSIPKSEEWPNANNALDLGRALAEIIGRRPLPDGRGWNEIRNLNTVQMLELTQELLTNDEFLNMISEEQMKDLQELVDSAK